MVLKFHMLHDPTTELQNKKIQPGLELKMAASDKKMANPIILIFSPERLGIFG